jgi:hypothetical protein
MKSLKLFSVFTLMAFLAFTSCKNEAAGDDARESLATTGTTTTDVTTPPPTPNNATTETTPVPAGPTTTMEFSETTFDFGEVPEGEKVSHVYKFTNTGSEPLIISNAKGSCGCTVPEWPKEPIAPGAASEIKVVFDSKGKGSVDGKPQSKRVTITANTDPVNSYLTIKGKVLKTDAPSS